MTADASGSHLAAAQMRYDVVIATRNRGRALEMSLPLFARQTRKPGKIIIVDASDDPREACAVADRALGTTSINYMVVTSTIRSSSYQRNRGLQDVTAPITMMPDDDSLWFSDTAEETMKIYEADAEHAIGGVTARSVQESPLQSATLTYRPSVQARVKALVQPWRGRLENRLCKQPFLAYAEERARDLPLPAWMDAETSRRVYTVGGFRMSFRTDVIRANPFDETLGVAAGYCQHEDMDVSLRIQRQGALLVSAERARVFHHTFPGKRTGGFKYGFGQVANYIYICKKVIPEASMAWRHLGRYIRYKIFLYGVRRDPYGKDVAEGAWFAWNKRHLLLDAAPSTIESAFRTLCAQIPASAS